MTVTSMDTTAAIEAIAATEGILLVDFTASWCPPCRTLEPVLEQLDGENGDLTVLSVDVDASPELARGFDVMSMPTMVFFRHGRPVHRLVGARGIASMREELHQVREVVAAES